VVFFLLGVLVLLGAWRLLEVSSSVTIFSVSCLSLMAFGCGVEEVLRGMSLFLFDLVVWIVDVAILLLEEMEDFEALVDVLDLTGMISRVLSKERAWSRCLVVSSPAWLMSARN